MANADLQTYAANSASAYGVPPSLLLWQIGQESSWNPNATNGSHVGLGQFDPATWARFGVGSRNDPYASIDATAAYDSYLYGKTGNWTDALTSYGTLQNATAKTWSAFQNALTGSGASSLVNSDTNSGPKKINADSFITKIAYMSLGLIVIAGAVYTYRKT